MQKTALTELRGWVAELRKRSDDHGTNISRVEGNLAELRIQQEERYKAVDREQEVSRGHMAMLMTKFDRLSDEVSAIREMQGKLDVKQAMTVAAVVYLLQKYGPAISAAAS